MGYGESYYVGDYYMGDPGIGGALIKYGVKGLGMVAKKILPRAIGALGGPVGVGLTVGVPIAAAGYKAFGGGRPGLPLPGGSRMRPQYMLPGGKPGIIPTEAPKGYHINKAYRRWEIARSQGRAVKEPYWVNMVVRNRAMNFANPRALRRAASRGKHFVRMYRRFARMFGARPTRCAPKRGRK